MYERFTLPNGVRFLTERVPGVRSAALGIWVGTGSRQERPEENGAAHFIEHMLFKGTQQRTAAQLAEEMDALGGQFNAFTTKECTCFHARVLDAHLPLAADILCDMFFHSAFDQTDVETERGVILEEIGMYEDNPEDLSAERLAAEIYRGTPLARPILGTRATLEGMSGAWLKEYQKENYTPERIVVALAGSFRDSDVAGLMDRFAALSAARAREPEAGGYTPGITVQTKPIEQNHLTLAFPGLTFSDPDRYALQLLSTILGGGASSRLFQQVREQRGLCYTVYSYGAAHADTGYFGIYSAMGRETERQALDTILNVVDEFADHGVTQQELDRAREQSKASVLLGLESTQAHMSSLARGELVLGRVVDPEEIIRAYDGVTREAVQSLAQRLLRRENISLSAVGKVGSAEEYRAVLHPQA